MAMNDFKLAFNGHQMRSLIDCENMVVPRFKGLPDKYRYFMIIFFGFYNPNQKLKLILRISLSTPNNEMGRKVAQTLNLPTPQKSCDQPSTSQMEPELSEQDETPKPKPKLPKIPKKVRQQPPKKKKKKKRVETSSDSSFSSSATSSDSFEEDEFD